MHVPNSRRGSTFDGVPFRSNADRMDAQSGHIRFEIISLISRFTTARVRFTFWANWRSHRIGGSRFTAGGNSERRALT